MQYNKIIIITGALFIFGIKVYSQSMPIFNVPIESYNGTAIKLSDFRQKPLLIWVAGANFLTREKLKMYDSLSAILSGKITTILVPAEDFGNLSGAEVKPGKIKKEYPNITIVSMPYKAKKENNQLQGALLAWLTNKNQNSHFNTDITNDNFLFIITKTGRLIGMSQNGFLISPSSLGNLLKNLETLN
jgi:glutathione peroxidase-family protein